MISQHRARTGTGSVDRPRGLSTRPGVSLAEETARLILTLFRHYPREVRLVRSLLGIDPKAPDAALRSQIETFFRGVHFLPQDRAERSV